MPRTPVDLSEFDIALPRYMELKAEYEALDFGRSGSNTEQDQDKALLNLVHVLEKLYSAPVRNEEQLLTKLEIFMEHELDELDRKQSGFARSLKDDIQRVYGSKED